MASQKISDEALGILIDRAEKHSRDGNYRHAVKLLASCAANPEDDASAPWLGLILAATARNKLHRHDDAGATHCLARIPQDVLRTNPRIAAEFHTITGILQRRAAYRAWKAGQVADALVKVESAVKSFQSAEQVALLGLEDRLRFNSVLNRAYARGLSAAIQGTSAQTNGALVCEAILAEAKSRQYTAPVFQNHLTGLTIIADLAIGAGIELGSAFSLSADPAYQVACREVIGLQGRRHWADLLLHEVRYGKNTDPETLSQTLVLGSKSLLTDGRRDVDSLMKSYAIHLRMCYMDLRQREAGPDAIQQIERAFLRFPKEIQRAALQASFR